MINLQVAEFCHNCPEFEAEHENETKRYTAGRTVFKTSNHTIRCTHREKCIAIRDYLIEKECKS